MTTRVTVDAHAGWDVRVGSRDPHSEEVQVEIVPANTTKDFYIHDSMVIVLIEEVKKT